MRSEPAVGEEQSITAACTKERIAIGGSAQVLPERLEGVALQASALLDKTQWTARARAINRTDTEWQLEVTVICAVVAP